jgi:hypothetical protein
VSNQKTVDVPPVFIGLDDLESGGVFKGPWEKPETMQMFSNLIENNRIGVSSDPTSGAFFDNNVDMALRATPGNVEVGVLHKQGNSSNKGVGWAETSLDKFVTGAELFTQAPYTIPTVHAPVDVNWMGIETKDNKIILSDESRNKELRWLEEQIIPKVKPFANVIAIKKEEGYLDKNFRMPIVFHSTPPIGIYRGEVLDTLRTTQDVIYDIKGDEEIYRGNLDNLAKQLGYQMPDLESSYKPGEREKIKEKLLEELEENLENKIKKSVTDSLITSKKFETTEKIVSDLYEVANQINDPIEDIEPSEKTEKLVKKLEEVLGSSLTMSKLEEGGVSLESAESFLKTYNNYRENWDIMPKEDIEKYKSELKEKLEELKKELEVAKDTNIPIIKRNIISLMGEKLKDIYKRLGKEEKVEDIEKKLEDLSKEKDFNYDSLYKEFQKELENVSNEIKDKKLVELKSLEERALEKTSDSIAEFATKVAKDPILRENTFIAIENFFPEDFFGGKIKKGEKEEWAMKALLEEAREKFKEKAKKEGIAKNDEEANKLANELIGMTLDMGHFNLWRSRGKFKDEEEFLDMAKDFVKSVAPFVKHFHLTDNPGTADTHQEIGTGNVPNELAFDILRETWDKEDFQPTMTIEWGGPTGPAGTQPSNYVNWRAAVDPVYGSFRVKNYSNLYKTFSYQASGGFYYKQNPYLTSWLT